MRAARSGILQHRRRQRGQPLHGERRRRHVHARPHPRSQCAAPATRRSTGGTWATISWTWDKRWRPRPRAGTDPRPRANARSDPANGTGDSARNRSATTSPTGRSAGGDRLTREHAGNLDRGAMTIDKLQRLGLESGRLSAARRGRSEVNVVGIMGPGTLTNDRLSSSRSSFSSNSRTWGSPEQPPQPSGPRLPPANHGRYRPPARQSRRRWPTPRRSRSRAPRCLLRLHYYSWRVGEKGTTDERRHRAAQ